MSPRGQGDLTVLPAPDVIEAAMMGLGIPELFVILVIALLVFGPSRLPEVGTFLGKSLRAFRDSLDHRDDDTDEIDADGKQGRDKLPPDGAA
jgi:sec-independent protein translocase protein TatA